MSMAIYTVTTVLDNGLSALNLKKEALERKIGRLQGIQSRPDPTPGLYIVSTTLDNGLEALNKTKKRLLYRLSKVV